MAGSWDWENNTEYRDGVLYGKPGSRIIRIFMDDGTGLWSPFVSRQAVAGNYGKRIADPKSGSARTKVRPRGWLMSKILQYLSKNGGLHRLNDAEVIEGVNDIDWFERIRNEPNRKEIMERAKRIASDDVDLEKLGGLISHYFDFGDAGIEWPVNFLNAGVGADPALRSLISTVTGGHEGLSGLIVPSRRESLWGVGDRNLSFYYGGDYLGSPSEIFNSIYDRDSRGKYKTARALFDAIILDNFFHSKAYEGLSEDEKRLFDGVEDYGDLVDAVNKIDLSGVDEIKGGALRQFVMDSLRDIPVTYAFDPNPSGSDIDDRLVNNAMVDKLVEGLANVGYDTMSTASTNGRNPDNLVAGVVSIDGERVIDNTMRSRGEEDVRADTPVEGLVSGGLPLFSKSTVRDMIDKNIPMYVNYRKNGADSVDAWADEGSLGDIFGELKNIDSDERLKVVRDTAGRIRDYADRRNIVEALRRGLGSD